MNPNRDVDIDIAKFDYLFPLAYPKDAKDPKILKFARDKVVDEVWSFGHLLEKAISVQCKFIRESTVGRDFANGDDAKCVVARTHGYGTSYSAPVTNIHRKQGNLLITVYERKQDQWYLFKIPYIAYKDVPKSSNIDIPFELDGSPSRIPKKARKFNWWDYEVKTFKDLGK
jgi:hypothetical protein